MTDLSTQELHRFGRVRSDGLELRGDVDFETWKGVGKWLLAVSNASTWCLGDWLLYGEHAFGDRYRQALAETNLDYQTLRNYAWVARRFPASRRHDRVSFPHHAEVAALSESEQELWLQRAERSGWSRNELRRQLGPARQRNCGDPPVVVRIEVPLQRERHWRAAAAACERTLADWLVGIANSAALTALGEDPSVLAEAAVVEPDE